jgi:predicted nucleotidyltransferase
LTVLDLLAEEVNVSGRTLRRAASRGLIRAERTRQRELVLAPSEAAYVHRTWPLFSRLLEALRKQPNVRLAVLFGSVARGEETPESDLDLLVHLGGDGLRERAVIVDALHEASGQRVQLVSVDDAEQSPVFLADVLADGRVLVDRDGEWEGLCGRRRQIQRRAREEDRRLTELAWGAPEALARIRDKSAR